MKTALITGVTGQDGAYLAKLLLEEGYEVYGTYRPCMPLNSWRLQYLEVLASPQFHLYECDLIDFNTCKSVIELVKPNELYNLAAQSYVGQSFKDPFTTAQINGIAALNLLEAIRVVNPGVRFYQASSSELFGQVKEVPQSEETQFHPRSPYAVAKLFAHWSTINYRETYGIFATCGILFNHESPLRSKDFVSRKITHSVARIANGLQDVLVLGNIDVARDWGYAKEYVEGMYRMLQCETADTFVLASNRSATVREFADLAFQAAGISLMWEGIGINSRAIDRKSGQIRVSVDDRYYRPCEVGVMRGDASKAYTSFGWSPKFNLESLCQLMVEEDLRRIRCNFPY